MLQILIATYLAQGYVLGEQEVIEITGDKSITFKPNEVVIVSYFQTKDAANIECTIRSSTQGHTYRASNLTAMMPNGYYCKLTYVLTGEVQIATNTIKGCFIHTTKLYKPNGK